MSQIKKNFLNPEITPREAKEILRYMIKNNADLASKGKKPVALNISGPAGASKTSICKQVAEEFHYHFVRLNLAEVETSDITGYPVVEYKVCKGEDDCKWIPDKLINDYILQGYTSTSESRMNFAKPAWIQGKEDKPIILLLDDYTRAVPMLLQACMRITDEQDYISWSLPQGSTVILTTNPTGGDYLVTEMDSAQDTRYLSLNLKPSVNDWAEWAEEDSLDGRLINFMLKHPEIIEGSEMSDSDKNQIKRGNLRIWTKFFHSISGISDFSTSWDLIFRLGQNSLPGEHLILLNKFIEDKLDKLLSVEDMLKKDIKYVKGELAKVIGTGDKKRTDLSAVVSKRLLNYCLANYKQYDKNMINNYGELLESDLLKADLVLLSLKKVITLLPELVMRPNIKSKLLS